MSQKYYDTVILGATFSGLGAALSLENAIVIEKGGLFGAEFVNSYKVCEPKNVKPKTKSGNGFLEDLKRRGLVSESGEIYPAPAVYVISSHLKEKYMVILLMTEVTEINKVDGAYHVTVYHAGGFETIVAKRIIDTTNTGIGHEKAKEISPEKYLNVIIYNPDDCKIEGLTFNHQNGLYTYSLPVGMNMGRYDAIKMLCGMKNQFLQNNMQISSIATDFSYTMKPVHEVIDDNFIWDPSTAYTNLVEAFDRGVQIAEEVRV